MDGVGASVTRTGTGVHAKLKCSNPFACPLNPLTPHATYAVRGGVFGSQRGVVVSVRQTRSSRVFVFNSTIIFFLLSRVFPFATLGSVGATNMNEQSSRSHAIFTITLERSDMGVDKQQHVRVGKLHMVDLAVSNRTPWPPHGLATDYCCMCRPGGGGGGGCCFTKSYVNLEYFGIFWNNLE